MAPSETPGATLGDGRYELRSRIGIGGMAAVFKAWDRTDRQWRAIKMLRPEWATRPRVRKRFGQEARAMARLDHRHIVRVYGVDTEAELPYLVMEYCDGGSLWDWIEQYGPMPAALAVDVAVQVCKGLQVAHDSGVIHRDIKPHNIMVTRRGVCKITDFGIAHLDDSEIALTRTGLMLGTMGYMAPEQRTDAKNVDVRADVYSVATSLFALVADAKIDDLFLLDQEPERLDIVAPALRPVLVRATRYRRDERYPTVAEFARALAAIRPNLPRVPDGTPPLALPPRFEEPFLAAHLFDTAFTEGDEERARNTPPGSLPPVNTGRPAPVRTINPRIAQSDAPSSNTAPPAASLVPAPPRGLRTATPLPAQGHAATPETEDGAPAATVAWWEAVVTPNRLGATPSSPSRPSNPDSEPAELQATAKPAPPRRPSLSALPARGDSGGDPPSVAPKPPVVGRTLTPAMVVREEPAPAPTPPPAPAHVEPVPPRATWRDDPKVAFVAGIAVASAALLLAAYLMRWI